MKLWIDDIRNAPNDTWTVARSVTEAIRAIARFRFSEISIDHDIAHEVTKQDGHTLTHSCDECFCAVVYFIGERFLHRTNSPTITLHSANPEGAKEMKAILEEYDLNSEIKPNEVLH